MTTSPFRTLLVLVLAVVLGGVLLTSPVLAQDGAGTPTPTVPTDPATSICGESVTVVEGDTLSGIAVRCGTTVEALLAANPQITDPTIVVLGTTILMPTADTVVEVPTVTIWPTVGDPGTEVWVIGNSFDPDAALSIGFGPPDAEYELIGSVVADADGAFSAPVIVPETLEAGQPWVLVVVPTAGGEAVLAPSPEPVVTIFPLNGETGTDVTVIANGFPPNAPARIGFGPRNSEYSVIEQVTINETGAVQALVPRPEIDPAGPDWVLVVETEDRTVIALSAPFTFSDETAGQPGVCPPTYTIVEGDTLSAIAVACETTVEAILAANPGLDPLMLSVDQEINIPTSGVAPTPAVPDSTAPTPAAPGALPTPTSPAPAVNPTQPQSGALFTQANIYLIALEDNGQSGMMIGCNDSVIPVQIVFEPTAAPLTAALQSLLAINTEFYGESGLYNALHQSDLALGDVTIVNGLATINLAGTLVIGGACDEPRVEAQLQQTALQYNTVTEVAIFVNGEPLGL